MLGRKIAQGGEAELFERGRDRVLKLYRGSTSPAPWMPNGERSRCLRREHPSVQRFSSASRSTAAPAS